MRSRQRGNLCPDPPAPRERFGILTASRGRECGTGIGAHSDVGVPHSRWPVRARSATTPPGNEAAAPAPQGNARGEATVGERRSIASPRGTHVHRETRVGKHGYTASARGGIWPAKTRACWLFSRRQRPRGISIGERPASPADPSRSRAPAASPQHRQRGAKSADAARRRRSLGNASKSRARHKGEPAGRCLGSRVGRGGMEQSKKVSSRKSP